MPDISRKLSREDLTKWNENDIKSYQPAPDEFENEDLSGPPVNNMKLVKHCK